LHAVRSHGGRGAEGDSELLEHLQPVEHQEKAAPSGEGSAPSCVPWKTPSSTAT
jgi:hypothetical protein